jgi:uncharacterized protein
LALAVLVVVLPPGYAADPQFPALTGRIVDNANLLSAEDEAAIEAELATLEGKSTDQLVVVTLPTLQGFSIEDYGYKLGRHWGIGQAGKDNGVLLIVAPNDRKVRIEVGKRLEPIMTDAMSKIIVSNAVLPAFRRGDFPAGIKAGVRDIKDVLLGDAESVKERARGNEIGGAPPDTLALIIIAIWIAIFLYVMWVQWRHARQFPQSVNRRRGQRPYGDGGVIIVPSGSGGWTGGSDWGGGGGGGWSGGGGTFSGGGASGDW